MTRYGVSIQTKVVKNLSCRTQTKWDMNKRKELLYEHFDRASYDDFFFYGRG